MSTTYNKHELEKPLQKNYVSLNLKFKSTKKKANMNNIVFTHLVISMLINKHYNWKRFMWRQTLDGATSTTKPEVHTLNPTAPLGGTLTSN